MTPWVKRLIVANVVMYGLQQFVPGLTQQLELVPALLLVRPWTILTYMFLHDPHNIWHIAFNMLALYWFGPRVEERLGGQSFLGLYLVSGIGGGLLSFITPNVAIIGASGAIMGVLIAFAVYWPREKVYIWGVLPVEMWMMVGGYVLFDLVGFGANVAHFAHLGGLASGFLYLKFRDIRSPSRAWKKKVSAPPRAPGTVIGGIGNGDPLKRWRDIRLDDLHPINRDEIVRLLQKAQKDGTRSLTPEERATLDRFAGTT
jgi:membrane associated rhomboid family serine protease